jgi:hypothetical protein
VRRGWDGALPAPAWPGTNQWIGWQTPDDLPHAFDAPAAATPRGSESVADAIGGLARNHPHRADALLEKIEAAGSLTVQRALVVDALAEAMRDAAAPRAVVFEHPLAISAASRRRFNIGPLPPPDAAPAAVALSFSVSDWDRSTAMNAPGQSGSPTSPYFSNLAQRWAAGERVPFPFSEAAVQANAAATLTLVPVPRQAQKRQP